MIIDIYFVLDIKGGLIWIYLLCVIVLLILFKKIGYYVIWIYYFDLGLFDIVLGFFVIIMGKIIIYYLRVNFVWWDSGIRRL